MSETWTIGELAERAAALLGAEGRRANGRVRDVPGERLIRWYTTIGLVDPPLSRRGRIARYGRRHLLQLVAIKRLQGAGRSIAEIQAALAGATDAMLEAVARPGGGRQAPGHGIVIGEEAHVPADHDTDSVSIVGPVDPGSAEPPRPTGDHAAAAEPARQGPPDRFWARTPSPVAADGTRGAPPPGDLPPGGHRREGQAPLTSGLARRAPGGRRAHDPAEAVRRSAGHTVPAVRIAPGVTLVLDGTGRAPTTDDVQAVLAAAEPLLAVLAERKLR